MQGLNQFKQTTEQGVVALQQAPATIDVLIDPAYVGADLIPGQAVKIVDDASEAIKVTPATADTDDIFGFINYSFKKNLWNAGEMVSISFFRGNAMYMTSSAAIARNAQVMVVIATKKVATAAGAGKRIVGRALDKATAGDQLIRVLIDLPGGVVP